mgnify:CR=1 FL=1
MRRGLVFLELDPLTDGLDATQLRRSRVAASGARDAVRGAKTVRQVAATPRTTMRLR